MKRNIRSRISALLKKNTGRRAVSLLLIICLVTGLFPTSIMQTEAMDLGEVQINPSAGLIRIPWQVDKTQHFDVEVLVWEKYTEKEEISDGVFRDVEKEGFVHFGWLLEKYKVEGAAELNYWLPCATEYEIPKAWPQPWESAGTAVLDEEIWLEPDSEKGPGNYFIVWTGSINKNAVINKEPTEDKCDIAISVHGLGDRDKGVKPCREYHDGDTLVHEHGEHWLWPEQYRNETEFEIDYASIRLD